MTSIRSRKHAINPYALAFAAFALPSMALAEVPTQHDHDRDHDHHSDEQVTIKGERKVPYKADKVSSAKKTEAVVDTPQTVSVISKELLEDQNATTLADALRNTPGITMQLGENGSTSSGDTFQLRGFSAQSSIFLDGIRDLGAVSRDVFNVEQVEVAKGPAGSDIGRGASSGYINLVSKLPNLAGHNSATATVYSQGGSRATVDGDFRLGATSAARLNVMVQNVDVAGRDVVNNSGWGIAPSYALGLGTHTRFYIFGQVVHQDNVPDGGLPVIGLKGYKSLATSTTLTPAQLAANNAALTNGAAVDSKNYYGSNADFEKVDASMLTSKIEHDFDNGFHLTNTTRYGQTTMNRVLTSISTMTPVNVNDPSTWTVTRSRQAVDQDNKILANTTNLVASFETGGWTQDIATGVELNYEYQNSQSFSVTPTTTPATTAVTVPAANLYHPDSNVTLPPLFPTGATAEGETTTVSGYLFDTVKKGAWLFNGGVRVDSYSTTSDAISLSTAAANPTLPVNTKIPSHLTASGTLVSWNVGAVYKPRENGSVYIAYGNALTPPGGANFQLSASASSLSNAAFKPVKVDNLEVGTKWDVFGNHLSLSAAYYSTIAKNELAQADPLDPASFFQTGERKVDGIELGMVGQITPKWMISAGVQTMHTKITKGTTGNSSAGAATRWSPELTGTLWTTYKPTKKVTIGGGVAYTSKQLLVVNPGTSLATVNGLPDIPANWVVNAMASYDITPRLALQLNLYNVTDAKYISSLNNGGNRVILGKPASGSLSLNVRF